jgi:hypothetical protein
LVLGYIPTRFDGPRRPGQVTTILYERDYERICRGYEDNPETIETNLWAGNMSLHREDAIKVGFTTRGSLELHSDLQFGIRCREMGLDSVFDRNLRATHLHSRSVRRFAAECVLSGKARANLCRQYPDLASQIDPEMNVPKSLVPIIRFLGSKKISPIAAYAALSISSLAGRMRLWWLETAAVRLLRQIEVRSGFVKAMDPE